MMKAESEEDLMVTVGLLVRLEAKVGKEEEVAHLLESALPLVMDEPETIAWFAVRLGGSSFAIFDAFPSDAGRRAHLTGAAAALMATAGELFASPPAIESADILAVKL